MKKLKLKGGLITDSIQITSSTGCYLLEIDDQFIQKYGKSLISSKNIDKFNTSVFPSRVIDSNSKELFSLNINGEAKLNGRLIHRFDVENK